jgi:sigma-B regulation protein RsbU (phosphoserine phosphatase)
MDRPDPRDAERRIESLTVNLLECYEELDLIYRLSRGLRSALEAQASAELVLSEANEIFEADMGWIIPGDAASPAFTHLISGAEPRTVERLRQAVVQSLIERGRSQIVYSVSEELGIAGAELPASLLVAVLKTENAVHGALCVGRRSQGKLFTARDLKLAEVLASQAALAIEHSILLQRWRDEEEGRIRIEQEMRMAREIQSNLLPRSAPTVPGYDIAGRGVPASSVGGDYYDFIPVSDDRLALCLADVTGHGMPAALLMANLQATIRSQVVAHVTPAECARRANRLLFQSTDARRFATCFFGILHLASGRLTYSNAGHDHPLLVSPGGDQAVLDRGGLLLGVREEADYQEGTVTLEPGQILVIYSDGITESFDGANVPFGLEGLNRALERYRDAPAQAMVEGILCEAAAYTKGRRQLDDRTLVVVRRL